MSLSGAAVDLSKYENWFNCTFAGCSEGDKLADGTGATNGGWGQNVSSLPDATKVYISNDLKLLNIAYDEANPTFTADRCRWSSSDLVFRFKASFHDPDMSGGLIMEPATKFAFWIGNNSSDEACFYGYCYDGWLELKDPKGNVTAAFEKLFDILCVIKGGQISFYIEKDGGQHLLYAKDGRSSFALGGEGGSVSKVEFFGDGVISDFSALYRKNDVGFEIRR